MLTDVQLKSMAEKMRIPLETVCFKNELPPLKYNRSYIVNMQDESSEEGAEKSAQVNATWHFQGQVQSRKLRGGIYAQDGELISDSHELTFDLNSDNLREREVPVRFVLSRKADEANGQQVVLRLEELVEGTSHYREYKSLSYTIRRSFTSDFDF